MDTIDDVFLKLGGPSRVGQAIGVSTEHAASMRRRKSIPVSYWPALVADARSRGINEITFDVLVELHADPVRAAG